MSDSTNQASWVLEDRAISDPSEDAFDHLDIAKQLAEAVKSMTHATTIGLIGGFGTGKSSIGNLLEAELSNNRKRQVIRFSAEKHSGIARQRAMVYSLAYALQESGRASERDVRSVLAHLVGAEDRVQVSWRDVPFFQLFREARHKRAMLRGVIWSALFAATLYLLAVLGAVIFDVPNPLGWPLNSFNWLFTIAAFPAIGTAATTWTKAALNVPKITQRRPRAEAADEIERVFAELVLLESKQLVIIVDDIDRLAPDEVLEAIAAVKTFQQVPKEKPPFFVIACDDKIVEEAIVDASPGIAQVGNDDWRAAAEYLNKLFIVRQLLPPHMPGDMPDYAQRVIERHKHPALEILGDELDNVIGLLIHEDVRNPRHVIRLLNAFFADFRLARYREMKQSGRLQRQEVTGNLALLARLTVLKVDFRDAYEAIVADFDLLTAMDRYVTGRTLTIGQEQLVHEFLSPESQGQTTDQPQTTNEDAEDEQDIDGARNAFETDGRPIATILDSRLRAVEYLRATAGYVKGAPSLTPFIFLGQPITDLEIGSKVAESVRRALRSRDEIAMRQIIEGADDDACRHIVEVVARLIRETKREPQRSNAVHTAASALNLLDRADVHRIADEIAMALGRDPSAAPGSVLLLSTIQRSTSQHRAGLLSLLTRFPEEEEHELRDERAHAIFVYAVTDPSSSIAKEALQRHFSTLPEEGSWDLAVQWIIDASDVDSAIRTLILGPWFYSSLIKLASGAAEVADEVVVSFRRLISEAGMNDISDGARQATLRCLGARGAAPRRIGTALLVERDFSDGEVPAMALALARSVTGGPLENDPEQLDLILPLLTTWLPDYAESTYPIKAKNDDAEDEKRPVTSEVVAAALRALGVAQSTIVRNGGDLLRAILEESDQSEQMVVEGCVAVSDEYAEPESINGTEARTVLVDIIDAVSDEHAEEIGAYLTAPIAESDIRPEATSAIDHLPGLLSTKYGQRSAEAMVSDWRQRLAVSGTTNEQAETIMRAVDIAFLTVPQQLGTESETMHTRLSTLRGAAQTETAVFARRWLIKLHWPSHHAEIASDYAEMVSDLEAVEKNQLVFAIASWPSSSYDEVPTSLFQALAEHVADGDQSADIWSAMMRFWPQLDVDSRAVLVNAGVGSQQSIREYLVNLRPEEAVDLLSRLSGLEGFEPAVQLLAHNEGRSEVAQRYLPDATSSDRAWHVDEIDTVVSSLLADAEAPVVVSHALQLVDNGQGQAERGLDLLISILQKAISSVERSEMSEPLALLLPDVGVLLGAKIGRVVGLAQLNHRANPLAAALKKLRSREDGDEVAEAYKHARKHPSLE